MIITLHDNKSQWTHAQPLISLIDHMVYIFPKDSDTPLIGVVVGYTDNFLVLDEEESTPNVFIALDDIERIHYP